MSVLNVQRVLVKFLIRARLVDSSSRRTSTTTRTSLSLPSSMDMVANLPLTLHAMCWSSISIAKSLRPASC